MSTPFPLEEQAQQESPGWNPWQGQPSPAWYSGIGFTEDNAYSGPIGPVVRGLGEGAAKTEELAGNVYSSLMSGYSNLSKYVGWQYGEKDAKEGQAEADWVINDAKARVHALTPDPATTGVAAQTISGLASGAYRLLVGSLAGGPLGGAAAVGSTEAVHRYGELTDQGVTPGTAATSAAETGLFSAAGALMPMGFGGSLVSKIATGAAANVGFGLANRYADHMILKANGFDAMADQQKVWDTASLATDLVLGGAFGALAHLQGHGATPEVTQAKAEQLEQRVGRDAPGAEDAALTTNLAMHDRSGAPGVAIDPAAAQAHQAALEKASEDMQAGRPVNIAGTGVETSTFAARPLEDRTPVKEMYVSALKDAGVLDEQRNLDDLEKAFGAMLHGEPASAAAGATLATENLPARGVSEPAARAPETPEQEKAANQPYLPSEPEITAAGGVHTPENAARVATVARALELDQNRVHELAGQHAGDADGFVKAAKVLIDEHGAAASGGEGGAVAQEPAGGAAGGEPGTGRGGQPAGERGRAGAEPGQPRTAATAGAGEHAGNGTAAPAATGAGATAAGAPLASGVGPLAEASRQALQENPQLQIPDERGTPTSAAEALGAADRQVATGEQEAPKAIMAAAICGGRRGAG